MGEREIIKTSETCDVARFVLYLYDYISVYQLAPFTGMANTSIIASSGIYHLADAYIAVRLRSQVCYGPSHEPPERPALHHPRQPDVWILSADRLLVPPHSHSGKLNGCLSHEWQYCMFQCPRAIKMTH